METQEQNEQQADQAVTSTADEKATTVPAVAASTAQRTFTQEDVNRLLAEQKRALSEKQKAATAQAEDAARQAALVQQGEYKTLYEKAQAELAEKVSRIKQIELGQLRQAIAAKHGLSAQLADRLRGETEDELTADAKTLVAAMPKAAAPNINANGGAAAGTITDAVRAEIASKYGVSAKYIN